MSGRSFSKKGGATKRINGAMPRSHKKEVPMSEAEIAAARKTYELRRAQKDRLSTAKILKPTTIVEV